jgi:AcrR family transcriptional regulator
MASPAETSERTRRTQAERRAATREALLDAAVDCLAEEGYANTTTRRIAERSGVTLGAMQYHFASKAELLGYATRRIGSKIAQQILERGSADIPSIQSRAEDFLDYWWDLLKGPLFAATAELWVAARTDSELRKNLVVAQRDLAKWVHRSSRVLYPELVEQPGFSRLIATRLATMRGLAMLRFVDEQGAEEAWPATRAHLLGLIVQFSADAGVSP